MPDAEHDGVDPTPRRARAAAAPGAATPDEPEALGDAVDASSAEGLAQRGARPERRFGRAAALVCAAVAAHAAYALVPSPLDVLPVLAVWLVAAATLTLREWRASHAVLLCAALTLPRVVPALAFWPATLAAPLAVYALLALVLPRPRALRWLRGGALDGRTLGWVAATVVVSAGALGGWFLAFRPDVSDLTRGLPAGGSWALVAGLGLGFALLNAAIEESIWRGVLLAGLTGVGLPRAAAIAITAASFGAVHLHGFPRGWLGVAMASVYGGALAWLRLRAGGLAAPWLAHVGTDLAVFALLVLATGSGG